MNRRHRRRLVDVASLGVSVIDWHGRMEGREELWRSCNRKRRTNTFTSVVRALAPLQHVVM